ncbi:Na+/H+ antiporter subunit G [Methyloversatilis discipulorum]|uniref:Na+/H+ antiporter subunit G n=1 Tax=Methyloversatilis discipulorum TaxID=1119528 RepID=UPI001A61A4CD|nr:Na+/H+ antiporter subunit G [Methyloversatilis discipulorum]MBL8469481.1 Na+/H+ antiporter subunit G [Methyloversatilis discipulorum]
MIPPIPLWVEIPVALLLALSGVFTLVAAIGVVRFRSFFQRMHPPALAFSFSAWCVTLASILYFSVQDGALSLHAWLIIIFLSLTVPVTTILLSRTELFRRRNSGDPDMPPPLSACVSPPADESSPTPR